MPAYDVAAAQAWHSSNVRTRRRRRNGPAAVAAAAPSTEPVGDPVTRSWRDRKERADALVKERELALSEGRLLDKTEVLAAWQKQIASFRSRMLAIPSEVAAQAPSASRVIVCNIVEREIHEALAEVSGLRGDDDG